MIERRASLVKGLFGYAIALAATLFAIRSLGAGFDSIRAVDWRLQPGRLAACCALMLCHALLNREGFVRLGVSLNCGLAPARLRSIWARSLLAKYVPGGIWQLLGRGLLLRQNGASVSASIHSGLIEQGLSIGLCAAIALAAYFLLQGSFVLTSLLVVLCAAFVVLAPHLLPFKIDRTLFYSASATYTVAMPFYFGAYYVLVQSLSPLQLCAQLFAGTLAGMAAFFVPGGLGVRESFVSLLAPSQGLALLAALATVRVVTIAVEIGLVAFASLRPMRRDADAP